MNEPLVVGLGSDHGDDQAGWLVLNGLRLRNYPGDRLFRALHAADLLDLDLGALLPGEQGLIICDACIAKASPGSIHHFKWPTDRLVYQCAFGSHDLTLCEVLELSRLLHHCPQTAAIWAIEGISWCSEAPPSDEIRIAADRVAEMICQAVWDQ